VDRGCCARPQALDLTTGVNGEPLPIYGGHAAALAAVAPTTAALAGELQRLLESAAAACRYGPCAGAGAVGGRGGPRGSEWVHLEACSHPVNASMLRPLLGLGWCWRWH
jgi:hypothetical protein